MAQGNTIGNIANHGYAAKQGNWIYYSSNDSGKIYKQDNDGCTPIKVNNDSYSNCINVLDEWVYYSSTSAGGYYKIRTDGSDRTKIINRFIVKPQIVDGWIYFEELTKDNIYKVRTDGSNKVTVIKKANLCAIDDGWIYYNDNSGDRSEFAKMRTDGTCRSLLRNDRALYISISKEWIYYLSPDFNNIHKVRTDGRYHSVIDVKEFSEDSIDLLNVKDGWIYYSCFNMSARYRINKVTVNKGKNQTICRSPRVQNPYCLCLVNDWLIFENYDAYNSINDKVRKVRIDGTGYQLV